MRTILFFRNLSAFCRDFDQISEALESDFARIHENHKLDPPTSSTPAT